ncbi:hypothetical protein H0I76_17355 [Limibaculum sp. M0105]|uniref:Cytochrome c domain-containing protein n=1 Tax=Thermohalobaculum xanthum TaxID=2753746 RepID=A0A8J7M948_9RHOB|nr:hypothetical protein [Thermohalobaculum xanthum]MBK0400969.1 hypothetical protein [Thermohalobaculum xanthum]
MFDFVYNLGSSVRPALFATGLSAGLGVLQFLLASGSPVAGTMPSTAAAGAPATLAGTGLYADPAALAVDPAHIAFAPQYPLWTDGAEKRRWISLPQGSAVDASNPDVWDFPVGTRLWKEFAFADRRVETRYMERLPDGSWLFATYAWSEDGRDAYLVSEKGRRNAFALTGGGSHAIPGKNDCQVCHLSGPAAVLGFSARQLATDDEPATLDETRQPNRNASLAALVEGGAIHGLDAQLIEATAPGTSSVERAALGYLHGNCGHCHNAHGPLAKLGLNLRQSVADPHAAPMATTVDQPMKSPPPGLAPGTALRIAPGRPELSALPQRMASRWPSLQMPPLGTSLVDADAVDLINRWIAGMEEVSTTALHNEGSKQ